MLFHISVSHTRKSSVIMPESKDSRDLNRVRVMLRRGTTLSKRNPTPLTPAKIRELKRKRDELAAKQTQNKMDRETAKIVMVNAHTTKDGEMTRFVVAGVDEKITKVGGELAAIVKPLTDLVVRDSCSSIDAQTNANRVQISMLQAANCDLKECKRRETISAREARNAAKAKACPKAARTNPKAIAKAIEKAAAVAAAGAAANKTESEKEATINGMLAVNAATKTTTVAVAVPNAGSTVASMTRECLVVQKGEKRSFSVDNSMGVTMSVQDELTEDVGCRSSSSGNREEASILVAAPVSTPPATGLEVTTSQLDRMSQHSATTETVE